MDTIPEKTLLRALVALFAAGLPQDEAVAHYIHTTHGALSPAALMALLADRDDPQAASLAELLLFPGEAVAGALEPALAAANLDAAGADRLARELAATVAQALAVLPDGTRLSLPLTPEDARRFVTRLAPTRTLPARAAALLAERFGAEVALALAVTARQNGPDWTPRAAAFFTALASRLPEGQAQAADALGYTLRFLADLGPAALPVPALIARHGQLAAQLRRARQQEQALGKSNFETLIMTGARLPYLHAPDLARELALADILILAATGRPAPDTAGTCLNMGAIADMDGLFSALDDQKD